MNEFFKMRFLQVKAGALGDNENGGILLQAKEAIRPNALHEACRLTHKYTQPTSIFKISTY